MKVGDYSGAIRSVAEALATANRIDDEDDRDDALASVANGPGNRRRHPGLIRDSAGHCR